MYRLTTLLFTGFFVFNACSSKKTEIDELSYLKFSSKIEKSKLLEQKRTQIVSTETNNGISKVILAFAKDKTIPQDASHLAKNAYAIRFTLHDSTNRSKTLGGGTFVIKMESVGNNEWKVRNFAKTAYGAVRSPQFNIDDMDTILNPNIIAINNQNHQSILKGASGVLTPIKTNPSEYIIEIVLKKAGGETWGVDHGYINDSGTNKEPTKIINITNLGIEVTFPTNGAGTHKTYDPKTLGNYPS